MTRRERVLLRFLLTTLIVAAIVVYGTMRTERHSMLTSQAIELQLRIGDLKTSRIQAIARQERFDGLSRTYNALSTFIYSEPDANPYEFAALVNNEIHEGGLSVKEFSIREAMRPTVYYEIEGLATDILRLLKAIETERVAWIIESFSMDGFLPDGTASCTFLIGYRIDYESNS